MNSEYDALVNKFAADKQQTGFLYQFSLIIYCIFSYRLEETDRIVYEGEDDITINYHDGKTLMIQAKHSIHGEEETITNMDPSFWKAIVNWMKSKEAFQNDNHEINFFKEHRFRLITNRSIDNEFWKIAQLVKNGEKDIKVMRDYLKCVSTKNGEIKDCVRRLRQLGIQGLREFILGFDVEIVGDSLKKAKNALKTVYRDEMQATALLYRLLGNLTQDFYEATTNSIKFNLSVREFNEKYKTIFSVEQNLPDYVQNYTDFEIPENISSMNMSKQLELVDLVESSDFLPNQYKLFYNYNRNITDNIKRSNWQESDQIKLEGEAINIWNSVYGGHKTDYKFIQLNKGQEACRLGAKCFYDTMKVDFLNMPRSFCNGCYLKLSDDLRIGWHMEWEKLMKKQTDE